MAKIFCKVRKHSKYVVESFIISLYIIFSHYFLGNIFNYFEKIKMFILLKNLFKADGFLPEDNDKKSLKTPFLLWWIKILGNLKNSSNETGKILWKREKVGKDNDKKSLKNLFLLWWIKILGNLKNSSNQTGKILWKREKVGKYCIA